MAQTNVSGDAGTAEIPSVARPGPFQWDDAFLLDDQLTEDERMTRNPMASWPARSSALLPAIAR